MVIISLVSNNFFGKLILFLSTRKIYNALQKKQEVQGLQAFAFSVVTVNDEHAKSRLKRKLRG